MSVNELAKKLRFGSAMEREGAVRALAELGGHQSVSLLREALHDDGAYVRQEAAKALQKLGYASEASSERQSNESVKQDGGATNLPEIVDRMARDLEFADKVVASGGKVLRSWWLPKLNEKEIEAAVQEAKRLLAGRGEIARQTKDEDFKPVEHKLLREQYELLAEIGRGGFGAVYKARDVHLDQPVAVKELILDNPSALKEEAKLLAGLRHKNIVGFRQLFPDGDRWYMVMDFVDGGSLMRLIKSRNLYGGEVGDGLQRVLSVALDTAEGLGYAHQSKIIHQDVKPANVMVSQDGTAKVSDFGLANARPVASNARIVDPAQSVAVTGAGCFSIAYCSPEQAAGRKLTSGTDTWSWGLMVLHMTIGDSTWNHGTAAPEVLDEYLRNKRQEEMRVEMPQRLGVLLRRCFEKEPQSRPKMTDIIQTVTGIQRGLGGNWLRRFWGR